ncbi:MAG: hypothetical protein GX929_05050 [Clostridiales bacterium]|nr:hypothetical protein [Clostridiales bacterium]
MLTITERAALSRKRGEHRGRERDILFARGVFETPAAYSPSIRRAHIDAYVLGHYTVAVPESSLLAGTLNTAYCETAEDVRVFEKFRELSHTTGWLGGWASGQTGHRVVDYEKLLRLGLTGVLDEVDRADTALETSDPGYTGKRAVYKGMRVALNAVREFAVRYRQTLTQMADETSDAEEASRRRKMADAFSRAPEYPAETFHDALQAMWFLQFCLYLCGDISLTGRPDNYLWPYYSSDLKEGRITREEAFALIEELYLRHNEIYDAWPASVMLCGVDRNGNYVCNELSELFLDAIRTTGLVNPSVSVAWTPALPDAFRDKITSLLADGYTRPSIFNDRVIRAGLIDAGMGERDARYYIHSTCVEITPIGNSGVQVATPYINLNKAFEFMLSEGAALYGAPCPIERIQAKKLTAYADFDTFYADFRTICAEIIRVELCRVNERLDAMIKHASCPLASAFLDDCIARGMDAVAGGARYQYVYPCFPGFINLLDGLAAIRKVVFDEKRVTLMELSEACRKDFAGEETLLRVLRDKSPKFGNNDDAVDAFGREMFDFIREELKRYRTAAGGTFHPSYFAWVMHGRLGEQAAATPDGRRQGTALSEHLGAVQGMDREGPTAVMRSVAKLPSMYAIGGVATNFRFSDSFVKTPQGRAALRTLVEVCMDEGLFEVQFNVASQADLLDARVHPERHRSLLVRVAGYSDYFVNLLPVIQDEIIRRTAHGQL